MRWRIRKAKLEKPEYRESFERYGTTAMQLIMSTGQLFRHG